MKTHRRTRAITAHVTEEELVRITQQANTTNRSISEWARELLLNAVTQPTADFNTQVLLSETAATRASMVMLMQHAINGTKITEDDLVSILEECDQARFTMAAGRLRDALKVLAPSLRKGAA